MKEKLTYSLLIILLAALALFCFRAQPALSVDIARQPNYDRLDDLLRDCVSFKGDVNREKLTGAYAQTLRDILADFARVDASALARSRDRLAFWLNAYNVLGLQTLLDAGMDPAAPQKDGLFFTRRRYFIAGKPRSLDDIYHDLIRRDVEDPRVFAALALPGILTAPLRPEAYRPETLNFQLDQQCRQWINHSPVNRLDMQANTLYLAREFCYYTGDFDRLFDNPRGFYLKYITDPVEKNYLLTHSNISIVYEMNRHN